ncbi:DNA primase [Campylobacter sp. CCS1377]|uniref:DNA primase n=1 Tax=Campylobacter sp. CCS1377 TaxID=3158229 RepID=A0AAU7E5Y3_9BACT|nr:DNA primase [Campylobacter jejuni]
MIDKNSIENLAQRADIVDVISHYIEVKKMGSNFVCICPFHADKHPSMHIHAQKGFYHCFVCGAGGDVFKFVMEYEKLSFSEAVEKVASWNNFSLSYTKDHNTSNKNILHILPSLNAFYKQNLAKHKEALHYLYQRKLNDKDIQKFELGFAPSNEENLRLLRNEEIDFEEALSVGALKKDEQKKEYYASFIMRITFPIYDHKGLLVGFGGRTLNKAVQAKYVNSPQSRLFDKSRIFYAFNLAKDAIAKQKEMIVCEGYMDAIAFHKAGFNNAVAVLGTALTEHHLPLIKRYEAKVILCFDNDEAGLKAAMRSAYLLSVNKIDGKVALIQGGKDPAELVANDESAKLYEILEKAVELGEFYIRRLVAGFDLNSALAKQKALEEVQKFTHLLEPLVANFYTDLVAKLLGVENHLVTLVKNAKISPTKSKIENTFVPKTRLNIAEIELLKFLAQNANLHEDFKRICPKNIFKHQEMLEQILNDGKDHPALRELELLEIKPLENKNDFLLAICNVYLSHLNALKGASSELMLKKQILTLLSQNTLKIKKALLDDEFYHFFSNFLELLTKEQDLEKLHQILQKLLRALKNVKYLNDIFFPNESPDGPF